MHFSHAKMIFFLYFGAFGVIIPFSGLYFDIKGFSSEWIGIALGSSIVARMIGPVLFYYMRSLLSLKSIAQITALGAAISSSLLYFSENIYHMIFVLFFINLWWMALLPNIEVVTLGSFKDDMSSYGLIRMFGSIGFIFLSLLAGWLMIEWSEHMFSLLLSLCFLGILILVSCCRFGLTSEVKAIPGKSPTADQQGGYYLVYAVFFLIEMSHGPYYGFFSVYLHDSGYSAVQISSLIIFAVLVEVFAFNKLSCVFQKYSAAVILLLCLPLIALRWFLIDKFVDSFYVLLGAQLLHAISFALPHIAAMKMLSVDSDEVSLAKRQTVYTITTLGAGAALGAFLAGSLWDTGLAGRTSFISVGIAPLLLAVPIVLLMLRPLKVPSSEVSKIS